MDSPRINHDRPAPPQVTPIHLEAETMRTHTCGEKMDRAWDLWSDGYIADTITLRQNGNYRIDVRARGLLGGAYAPKLAVLVDGRLVDYANVTTSNFQTYSFQTDKLGVLIAGKHELKLAFTNHFRSTDADGKNVVRRNLILDAVEIIPLKSAVQPNATLATSPLSLPELAKSRGLHIGAAVRDEAFYGKQKDEYRKQLKSYASLMVAENAFKPRRIAHKEGALNFTVPDEMATFATENGMVLRGHTLVWRESVPTWLENKNPTREEAIDWLQDYIQNVVAHFKGKVTYWDVVNEAVKSDGSVGDSFWLRTIGPEYIELAFRFAHEADPDAKLFYNDFGTEELNEKSDGVYTLIKNLKDKGVSIDGIGFQTHLFSGLPPDEESMIANMHRFAKLGFEVQITELDVPIKLPITKIKLAQQADAYRLVAEACLAESACTAITTWGFTDRYSWANQHGYGATLMLGKHYQEKTAYQAVKEVLLDSASQR